MENRLKEAPWLLVRWHILLARLYQLKAVDGLSEGLLHGQSALRRNNVTVWHRAHCTLPGLQNSPPNTRSAMALPCDHTAVHHQVTTHQLRRAGSDAACTFSQANHKHHNTFPVISAPPSPATCCQGTPEPACTETASRPAPRAPPSRTGSAGTCLSARRTGSGCPAARTRRRSTGFRCGRRS